MWDIQQWFVPLDIQWKLSEWMDTKVKTKILRTEPWTRTQEGEKPSNTVGDGARPSEGRQLPEVCSRVAAFAWSPKEVREGGDNCGNKEPWPWIVAPKNWGLQVHFGKGWLNGNTQWYAGRNIKQLKENMQWVLYFPSKGRKRWFTQLRDYSQPQMTFTEPCPRALSAFQILSF